MTARADEYHLLAEPGWGSVLVETQLAWYGVPYRVEDVGDIAASAEARARLAVFNPLAQLPTLLLPDGRVMTESAAITLHLAESHGPGGLVPREGLRERPAFLRWLVFLVANIYPTFTLGDDPSRFVSSSDARPDFVAAIDAHKKKLWSVVEAAASSPHFLGGEFSALDIYVAAMTRWRPGRAWFAEHCPRLAAIAEAAEREPRLAAVWARNFPPP